MMCHAQIITRPIRDVNPLILLCPWSSDRMQQCPGNPPGELCARTDCWDSGGFLPDTTEQQHLQLSSLCSVYLLKELILHMDTALII